MDGSCGFQTVHIGHSRAHKNHVEALARVRRSIRGTPRRGISQAEPPSLRELRPHRETFFRDDVQMAVRIGCDGPPTHLSGTAPIPTGSARRWVRPRACISFSSACSRVITQSSSEVKGSWTIFSALTVNHQQKTSEAFTVVTLPASQTIMCSHPQRPATASCGESMRPAGKPSARPNGVERFRRSGTGRSACPTAEIVRSCSITCTARFCRSSPARLKLGRKGTLGEMCICP